MQVSGEVKSFQGSRSKKPNPSGYQGTKVPVSALPDRRRRPVVKPVASPEGEQLQLAAAVPPVEVRNVRPVPVVLELVAREVRSRSTVEPRERPLRELDQRREDLAGGDVGLTPEGVGTLTFAVLGVESQPDGTVELDLVGGETQVPFVSLDALPAVLGVARRGSDLVPEGVERVRHVEQQYLGLRPGRELLGRLGQNGVRPKLTGTGELLLGGDVPGRHARHELGLDRCMHHGSQVRLLDDTCDVLVGEARRGQHTLELDLLANGGVVEACHDGSLPFCDRRRLTR